MTSITINVDEDIREEAESLFTNLGFTISDAVNVFFRQAIRERTIPFKIKEADNDPEYFNEYNMMILKESIAQGIAGDVII